MLYTGDNIYFYTIVRKDNISKIKEYGIWPEATKSFNGNWNFEKIFLYRNAESAKMLLSSESDSNKHCIIKIDTTKICQFTGFHIFCFSQNDTQLWTYCYIPSVAISE